MDGNRIYSTWRRWGDLAGTEVLLPIAVPNTIQSRGYRLGMIVFKKG